MINDKPGPLLRLLLTPPSRLFGAVARLRGHLYDSSAFEVVDTEVPIISIGNLTAGGTGKTPITSFLTQLMNERGIQTAIVSRGYGAREKGPAQVPNDGSTKTAERFGDEPSWLAHRHPATPVMIGGKRPESVAYLKTHTAFANATKRAIVADDAFQHRRLKRNIDIVILDATEPAWHYAPLPLGRMREGFDALKRAQYIFLSKTNLAETEQLEWLRQKVKPFRAKVVEFTSTISGFVPLKGETETKLQNKRVVLASGIARPATFEVSVKPYVSVLKHFAFKDHHAFTAIDLETMTKEAKQLNADAIIVTEKDAVKLGSWQSDVPVYVSRLHATAQTDLGDFLEAVDRLVR